MTGSIPQGFLRQTGVVLRRDVSAEGNVSLYLLLKGTGPVWASAPGAGKGRIRFGGGVEPLTWGIFNLYKGARKFYLKSVEVKEDFWALRSSAEGLRTLLEWDGLLCRHLAPGLPCDDVAAHFYWCSVLVRDGADPGAAGWRFLRGGLIPGGLPLLSTDVSSAAKPWMTPSGAPRGLSVRAALRTDGEHLLTTPAGKFL